MKLTPLDIRHKEFKRGMRGYADVEVDDFLEQIADEHERLFKENIDLQERVEALEDKVTGYKRIEETLQKTLITARRVRKSSSRTRPRSWILRTRSSRGGRWADEAYSERQAIEQNLAKLRHAEEDFRYKFKTLLEGYMRQLQSTPDVAVATPDPALEFARHAEAIKEAIARESVPAGAPAEEPAEPVAPQTEAPKPQEFAPDVGGGEIRAPSIAPCSGAGRAGGGAGSGERRGAGRYGGASAATGRDPGCSRHDHEPAASPGGRPGGHGRRPLPPRRLTTRRPRRTASASCSERATTCSPTSRPG